MTSLLVVQGYYAKDSIKWVFVLNIDIDMTMTYGMHAQSGIEVFQLM